MEKFGNVRCIFMSEFRSGMLFIQIKDLILSYGVITSSLLLNFNTKSYNQYDVKGHSNKILQDII